MGASSSLISQATPEQQAEINAEVERLKGEGVSEEDIEKQLKEKYADLLNIGGSSVAKCVVVIGATGNQGGGVVRALSGKDGWTVKALTRNTESDKAKALAEMPGVSVASADMDNVDQLTEAFTGAYGVFCVTNFWEHFTASKEAEQCKNVATAAKSAGVSHVVWSTLEHTPSCGAGDSIPDIQNGGQTYKVPHFDGKGLGDKAFREAEVPTTFLHTSFYWDNLIYFGMGPKKGEDGTYAITFPQGEDTLLPGIAVKDIGICAAAVFEDPSLIGQTIGVAGEKLTCGQMAEKLTAALGQEIKFNSVPADVYRSFGFPGADDLGNMFQWQMENNADFCSRRDVELSKKLNAGMLDFDGFLAAHGKSIPME